MSHVGGFHHIAMKAADFDVAVDFYIRGMGFKKGISWGDGDSRAQMIDVGNNNYLEIFAGGSIEDERKNGLLHIALRSADCVKDLERAIHAGAVVTMEVTDVDIPSEPVKKVRIAFCKGLQGEVIEFFQEL
jgi:glyoxylase I family protein